MRTRLNRFIESRFFIPAVIIAYLALTAILFVVTATKTKGNIELFLAQLVPKALWLNFLVILIAAALNRGTEPLFFASGNRGSVPLFLGGLLLVALVAPQTHRIFFDEDIYANIGQTIALTGQAGMANYATFEYGEYFIHWLQYNKDPSGWPFLMSVAFQLFGVDERWAFGLNNLLFAGGVVVAFFITRLAGGGAFAGLLAGLIYALIPHNLTWANTIAAEPPAAFFGGLAVLCTLLWLRKRSPKRLLLLAAVLPFACTMRLESALIALWALIAAAVNPFAPRSRMASSSLADVGDTIGPDAAGSPSAPHEEPDHPGHPFADRKFWAVGLVAFAFFIPHLWHFYAVSGHSWGADGPKFSAFYLAKNLTTNGLYYFNNGAFPVLFTLLALLGLAGGSGRRQGREGGGAGEAVGVGGTGGNSYCAPLLILLWFALFWGIFLFFYAGSYKYGADVRFAVVSFMPLAILAGMGGDTLVRWLGRLIASPGGEGLTAVPTPVGGETNEPDEPEPAADTAPDTASTMAGPPDPRTERLRIPIAALLILILAFSWIKFLPQIRLIGQEAWGARYDHIHAREFIKNIPDRSIVLTHVPTMFLLWGRSAIQAYAGINNPEIIQDLMKRYDGHVYFHHGYWCNTVNDANRTICDGIHARYNLEPVAAAREQTHEYGLYRLSLIK